MPAFFSPNHFSPFFLSSSNICKEKHFSHLLTSAHSSNISPHQLTSAYICSHQQHSCVYNCPAGTRTFLHLYHSTCSYLRVVDGALPDAQLEHMQMSFGPKSPFWREHRYGPRTPYFSYLHELNKIKMADSSSHALEAVIARLYKLAVDAMPEVKEARYAEWWAHCRPHSAHHQLHFDSADEGRGKVEHPVASSVLYLTDGMGGPTLVTDQVLGGKLATEGWLSYPKVNRYTIFDGKVLHGVIPGVGATPRAGERRVTFMVAFWRDISSKQPNARGWGAAIRYPDPSKSAYTWPSLLAGKKGEEEGKTAKEASKARGKQAQVTVQAVAPHPIGKVWASLAVQGGGDKVLGNLFRETRVPHIDECFQP